MARGNRREDIFHDDDDRRFFLHTLSQACEMTGWRVHAWVLMDNHYHLFLQTPEPNLVAGMSWLQNTLTRRYNVRHRKWGRLFGDRYKAVIVEGEDRYHYQTLMDYIHLNPVRARLIQPKNGQSVMDYAWSSLASAYAVEPKRRAKWLAAGEGLAVREHGERQAGKWLKEGLKAAGLTARDLVCIKGSDARKVLLADLLWRRTVVSQEWLAEKLVMKSAANVCQQIKRLERKKALASVPPAMRLFLDEAEA